MQRAAGLLMLIFASLSSVQAGENILTPMLGTSNWKADDNHTARGNAISFKNSNETSIGFRYLYLLDTGLAVGANSYWYNKDVNTTTEAHNADFFHMHALIEYFPHPTSDISPFFGAGLGVAGVEFSGANLENKSTGGSSIELNAGALFRISKRLGMQIEYKYTQFDLNDNIDGLNTTIDTNANSFLIGWTIHI